MEHNKLLFDLIISYQINSNVYLCIYIYINYIFPFTQPVTFIGSKTRALYHLKKKPALIHWTTAWRRLHKKDQAENGTKKKSKRTKKFKRAVVGVSYAELQKKKNQKPEFRAAAREAALRELKERKKGKKSGKK